jgi:hypothetical protein
LEPSTEPAVVVSTIVGRQQLCGTSTLSSPSLLQPHQPCRLCGTTMVVLLAPPPAGISGMKSRGPTTPQQRAFRCKLSHTWVKSASDEYSSASRLCSAGFISAQI